MEEQPKEPEPVMLDPLTREDMNILLRQLEDTIRMVLDAEKQELKPNVPFAEVMKDLSLIQQAITAMAKEQEEIAVFLETVKQRVEPQPEIEAALHQEDRPIYDKLKQLETVCEGARERIHEQIAQNPKAAKEAKEMIEELNASSKRKSTKRKRKFRSMGNEQGGWLKS